MNERHTRVGQTISGNFNARERRAANSFFGGSESTRESRDQLRAALRTSSDAQLVDDLRFFFNFAVSAGETPTAAEVSSALRLLRG